MAGWLSVVNSVVHPPIQEVAYMDGLILRAAWSPGWGLLLGLIICPQPPRPSVVLLGALEAGENVDPEGCCPPVELTLTSPGEGESGAAQRSRPAHLRRGAVSELGAGREGREKEYCQHRCQANINQS